VQETEGWQAVQGGWMNNATSASFSLQCKNREQKFVLEPNFYSNKLKLFRHSKIP
jgi:hypothetical protein